MLNSINNSNNNLENKNSFTYQPISNGKIINNEVDSGTFIFINLNLAKEKDSDRQYDHNGKNIIFIVKINFYDRIFSKWWYNNEEVRLLKNKK